MTRVQCGMRALPRPHARIMEGNQGKSRKPVLARDEKLGSIVREPSKPMREGKHAVQLGHAQ